MKKFILFILFVSMGSNLYCQNLEKFIIAADWIHIHPYQNGGYCLRTSERDSIHWDRVQELKLNTGVVYISDTTIDDNVVEYVVDHSQTGFKVIVERWLPQRYTMPQRYYLRQYTYSSHRWKYQVEYKGSDGDFNTSNAVGEPIVDTKINPKAEPAWQVYYDKYPPPKNSIHVDPNTDSPGIIASNLVRKRELAPGKYTWKLNMRTGLSVTYPIPYNDVVATVKITYNSVVLEDYDFTGADFNVFSDANYHEFTSNSILNIDVSSPPPPDSVLQGGNMNDPSFMKLEGKPDYTMPPSENDLEVRIEWSGDYECYFDYIAFDNNLDNLNDANELFRGDSDTEIQTELTKSIYASSKLWRFKVSDEPPHQEWLAEGYIQRRVYEYTGKGTHSWYVNDELATTPQPAKKFQVNTAQFQTPTYRYMPDDYVPSPYQAVEIFV